MSFLAPLFFIALAGLAIPVLLHLTQREKKQIVHFPSLMFVRRIPYQSVRRRKIQHWLLLMVRLAALALIILAFARPLLTRTDALAPPGQGAREVVVLLDTSYSMGFADRWDRARAAANDAIAGVTASDRASVVLFASGAEISLRSTSEKGRLTSAISAAKLGAAATRYAPALKVAGSILAESTLPRREVVLISDFQRGGWRGEEGTRLPQGATLTTIPIQGTSNAANLGVTAVSLSRSTFANQERVAVTAGITNRTERPVSGSPITLEVGGLSIATKQLEIEPGGSTSVTFDPVTVSARNLRGTVRLAQDALATDNAFNFVISPSEPVRIALVDRGGPSTALFVTRALSIGESPRFEVVTRPPDALSDDDLRRSAVVILSDVPVSTAAARRLAKYVEQGGGLFVAAGPRSTWPQDVDVLPATLGIPVDRSHGDAARIGALEYGHSVFEPFRAPRSGDFSTAHIYGYRSVAPVASTQIIARFDGGAPAVVERRLGTGRVLLWASTLDLSWSDLPQRAVFLPFVHRAVRYLAAYREPQPWLTVGQVLDASSGGSRRQNAPRVVLTPSGRRVPLEDEGSDVVELTEQGFYELRGEEADVSVVASNVDPAEADLTPMDPKEIVAATVAAPGGPEGGPSAGVPLTPEAREKNQRLWWYLLCAGIVLLGLDTVLSNRLAKA